MMTDPHSIFELDPSHVSYSDTTTDTNLDSPAISISSIPDIRRTSASGNVTAAGTADGPGPVSQPGPGSKATNHPSTTASARNYTAITHPYAEPADAANPSPDTRPVFPPRI